MAIVGYNEPDSLEMFENLTGVRSAGFFCGRPCDMELVTRQYERPGHQLRRFQTFTDDIFIFSLLVYKIAH